jgi:hypothetical protein
MKGVRSEKEGFILDQSQRSTYTGENVRFGDPICLVCIHNAATYFGKIC